MNNYRIIAIDATGWKNRSDPYKALKSALQSPEWHGENLNALIDSIIHGGINDIELPFIIKVSNTKSVASEVGDELHNIVAALLEASEEYGNRDKFDIELR